MALELQLVNLVHPLQHLDAPKGLYLAAMVLPWPYAALVREISLFQRWKLGHLTPTYVLCLYLKSCPPA